MFFKDFVSVKRKKIKKGASQTYDTPSFYVYGVLVSYAFVMRLLIAYLQHICNTTKK